MHMYSNKLLWLGSFLSNRTSGYRHGLVYTTCVQLCEGTVGFFVLKVCYRKLGAGKPGSTSSSGFRQTYMYMYISM